MKNLETVMVTGGSGFIGSWCVIQLLQKGYTVRTTVRNLARENLVRAALGKVVDVQNRLSFHAAELTSDAGWDAATSGCDFVLHVASPVTISQPRNPDELIAPARDGTRRVIAAAIKSGVRRIVLTSSVAATSRHGKLVESVSDETVWTDLNDPSVNAYSRSKTLAERMAWDLIASSGGATTLVTVNPSVVLGPVLSGDYSASVQVVERLLSGRAPGIPRLGFNFVDVRDVSDLHVRAMTAPEAAGQRFIAAGTFGWMADLAILLRAHLGDAANKVPTRRIPDFLVRLAALFNQELRAAMPRLGQKRDFTSAKAQAMLGWRPRPLEETVLDCARSLIANASLR
jgi:nucleoside-diphosphate-sugar epimerase